MRFMALARRNFKEMYRDLLSLGLNIGLPVLLLLVLQTLGTVSDFYTPTKLAPGITVYGFAMLTFGSGAVLARDRESALLSRLLTAPLRSSDFISAYSLPFIVVAIIQMGVVFGIGALFGLEIRGSIGLVLLVLFVMAICFIGLGMLLGSLFTYNQLGGVWSAVNILTAFAGAWFDLEAIGGVIQRIMNVLPFAHAIDAARNVMVDGVGFGSIATDFYWVLGYTLVFFGLGVFLFRRRMLE